MDVKCKFDKRKSIFRLGGKKDNQRKQFFGDDSAIMLIDKENPRTRIISNHLGHLSLLHSLTAYGDPVSV